MRTGYLVVYPTVASAHFKIYWDFIKRNITPKLIYIPE
jgi:hypothetical protein